MQAKCTTCSYTVYEQPRGFCPACAAVWPRPKVEPKPKPKKKSPTKKKTVKK